MQCERYPHAAGIPVSGLSVKCPVIDIPNGMVVKTVKGSPLDLVSNTIIQIACSPGFKLNGANLLRCGADGSWTPSVPTCVPVKCPVIDIPNAMVVNSAKGSPREAVFNTIVQIACSSGFKLNGANQLRCGADGSWTPSVPTCVPGNPKAADIPVTSPSVTCLVMDIPNGMVVNSAKGSPREAVFNTIVQITCSSGFKLNGANLLRCGADGSWTPDVPTCEPVTCPVIDVLNGQVSPQQVVFDTVVHITCSPGFRLNGADQLRCGADASWTPNVPTCEPVTCPVIDIPNGMVVNNAKGSQELVFDTVVQIACSPGFKLNGADQLRCGADASWTPSVPTCEPVTCPVIDLTNGRVIPPVVVFDTVVHITCSPGFRLNGADQLRCGADASWTPSVPTCEPVTCPVIDIPNGMVVNNAKGSRELVFDTVVQIACSPGFKLNGADQLRCGADASWTPNVPTCEPVTCPDIDIPNGQVIPPVVVFDTVVHITCSPGFRLNGADQLRCGADASWTPNVPTCEPVTCPVIDIPNGMVVNYAKGSPQELVFNTVVQIACYPGFKLNGADQLHCGTDSSWTPSVPTCEPVTCPVIDILNGQVSPQQVVFDTVVHITCSPGFRLNGADLLRCGADASWTPNVPTCEPVTCPVIDIPNGMVVNNAKGSPQKLVFNTVVQIACSPGFKLNGVGHLRCGADASWTPNVPTCEPVTCPVIDLTNGRVIPPVVVFDTIVHITCSPGFRLNGADQLRCGADASWTPNVPTCEPVTCPVIDIPNGILVGAKGSPSEAVFNTVVQITCSPGFKLNGASQLRCGADASWTPNVPTCEPVTCSTPVVENGMINGERPWYKPKDTVVIMCRRGFNMIGSPQVTCGLDGQWQALPRCLNEWRKP
ncbi:sushi, von Willebrand factor type A, EGF and pentraxin domain-containing protein 1-like [Myxocyprinus asiaticus]|uniref:sushi, von Willebrand factor type A, EGF and pentraxin domain-containing protein 1-like n=1 Tax=Myxocyprinus asiaticus TaxID=70543 RepID=UPI0022216CFB|nr:sushi, von Willebrand factor type A, EGF and pentraxin domain-containing protein 1-like [Myxocyprinus asiaticus]